MKKLVPFLLFSALSSSSLAAIEIDEADRIALGLTVFNSNLAVVRDTRELTLPTGEIEIEVTDVAGTVIPAKVSLLAEKKGFVARQQSYRFDLINRQTLLQEFVGRKLKYSRFLLKDEGYEKVLREGILLSIEPEIVQFGDVIEIDPEGTISLPYLPDELHTTPSLMFVGENRKRGTQALTVRYHTTGVRWEADYSLTLEKEARLDGWVTISNNAGSDFPADNLRLVAGDVNVTNLPKQAFAMEAVALRADAGQRFEPTRQTAGEYHAYDFPGRVMLRKNDVTQLRLASANGIRYQTIYRFVGAAQRYGNQSSEEMAPAVIIAFDNVTRNGLGEPLPAGNIRVYEAVDDRETFIGESRVGHSRSGANVELEIGKAFDVAAKRRQLTFKKLGERSTEVGYEIEIDNAKDDDISIELREQMGGDWEIVSESHDGQREDNTTYLFTVPVAAGKKVTVRYQVRFSW